MTDTEKLNGDTGEVNGIANDVPNNAETVKVKNDDEVADPDQEENSEDLESSKTATSNVMETDADAVTTDDDDKSLRKSAQGTRGRSPRGVKRRATSSLSHISEDGEDFEGFTEPLDSSVSKRLREIIVNLEAETPKSEDPPAGFIKLNRKESTAKGQNATPGTDSPARPSSGLSQGSEDLHASGGAGSLLEARVINSATSSPVPGRSNRKSIVDLSNPLFRVPLEQGWKRELVYRAALDSNSRRTGDIYYYTPKGKKVRSSREVGEHLTGTGLTLENFSFFKEALGIDDPTKEIIRDAKAPRGSPATSTTPGWTPSGGVVTPRTEGKRTPKPKPPKGASLEYPRSNQKNKTPKLQMTAILEKAKSLDNIPKGDSPKGKPSRKSSVNSKSAKVNSSEGDTPRRGSSRNQTKETPAKDSTKEKNETPKSKSKGTSEKNDTSKTSKAADTPKSKTKDDKKKLNTSVSEKAASATKSSTSSRGKAKATASTAGDGEDHFTKFYEISNEKGYKCVEKIFQYLKMRELAEASRVCTLWNRIVNRPSLWKHIRMKNSQVSSWKSLCAVLRRHGTVILDLRKMLLPQACQATIIADDTFWRQFIRYIPKVTTLERLELCRCPAFVVEEICKSSMNLKAFNALSLQCEELDPSHLNKLTNLEELRLKSQTGFSLMSDLTTISSLTRLKHLSLTSIKDLGSARCEAVGQLLLLESAELGECSLLPADFGAVLAALPRLRRLRLERGASSARLLRQLATAPSLRQLELVNFDVKADFDEALAACTNLRRLLLIPTYVSQSATTNRQVLSGLLRLKDTLTHLMWGVTIELLRVTELFIDQCEQNSEKKNKINYQGDCIPVIKPVPGYTAMVNEDGTYFDGTPTVPGPPQVEILPLPVLRKLLTQSLPKTKLKVLKIPFHATWRQTLSDFQ